MWNPVFPNKSIFFGNFSIAIKVFHFQQFISNKWHGTRSWGTLRPIPVWPRFACMSRVGQNRWQDSKHNFFLILLWYLHVCWSESGMFLPFFTWLTLPVASRFNPYDRTHLTHMSYFSMGAGGPLSTARYLSSLSLCICLFEWSYLSSKQVFGVLLLKP